jgi:hypothetical protein
MQPKGLQHWQEKLPNWLYQDELNKAADAIKLQADRLGNLPLLSGPGPGLDALLSAHQALVAYAKSDKSPQDLIELVDATDVFASRATVIADAVKQIQQSGSSAPCRKALVCQNKN